MIGDLYCKRRLAEFGAQLENGALELDDVMAQFEEILHGANGEGTFRDAFRVKKLADMSRELPPEIIPGILYRGAKLLIGRRRQQGAQKLPPFTLGVCAANGLPGSARRCGRVKCFSSTWSFSKAKSPALGQNRRGRRRGHPDNIEVACLRGKLTSVEEIKRHVAEIKNCEYQLIVVTRLISCSTGAMKIRPPIYPTSLI